VVKNIFPAEMFVNKDLHWADVIIGKVAGQGFCLCALFEYSGSCG